MDHLSLAMAKPYELEKKIWTEADFSRMGWHDAKVYAMAFFSNVKTFDNELVFDLDYILQWINPVLPDPNFSFWIAPCTLVFKNVYRLKFDLDNLPPNTFDFEILDIDRLDEHQYPNGQPYWNWHIATVNGYIDFEASSYEQIVKQAPVHAPRQEFPDRGETNFSRLPFTDSQI
jgi:hypothetical protein